MMVCHCLITFCQRGMALLLTSLNINVVLNALKHVSLANVNKVKLKLGIKVGGKMGVPFVTEGTIVN